METVLRTPADRDTPAGVLGAIRGSRERARAAEVDTMIAALAWAAMHRVDSLGQAATVPGTDREVAIAGEGAPLVAEFAVVELATALGRSADSARLWLGNVMELRHRLPTLWSRLADGPLEPWRALRIAGQTQSLSWHAAAWVDAQIAPVAHKVGVVALERLVDEAVRRFDPDQAYDDAIAAAERRHVHVETRQIEGGCVTMTATLDAADARDLDAAIAQVAHELLLHGSPDAHLTSPDVRRSLALGEIARRELAADRDAATGRRRDSTLYVHIDADALDQAPGEPAVARVEHGSTSYSVNVDRIREWLTVSGSRVSIRPVIDLPDTMSVTGYQPSERLREQVVLRRSACCFPYCTRPARAADLDHIVPHRPDDPGGGGDRIEQTSSENLAPLCRLHHRAKTHTAWTYTQLAPGEYLWRSPHAQSFHVDATGTVQLHDQRPHGG